jgi:hypothetical protein
MACRHNQSAADRGHAYRESAMMEFADIFAEALTTTVYVYGSVAFLAAYSLAAMLFAVRARNASPAIALGDSAA